MSRILLLLIFLLWMAWSPGVQPRPVPAGTPVLRLTELWPNVAVFVGFYALLVLVLRLWSMSLARRVAAENLNRSLRRFNKTLFAARLFIPAWFGFGVFALGWGWTVKEILLRNFPMQLPGILLGTLPAFLAWMGLWWAQFPADQSLREQNLLSQLEADLPVYAPPAFRDYFVANFRLQILFTIAPVLLIMLTRDVLALLLRPMLGRPVPDELEYAASMLAAGLVFLFAPEILRRVLQTQPLPDSALRRRLEALCVRTGMRYRDILLWRTQNNMGNAAVMGVIPQVRYILLSDLLLERMDDDQIEAVFAHEVGHVVHRHMAWYVVFIVIFTLALTALSEAVGSRVDVQQTGIPERAMDVLVMLGTVGGFLLFFGYLSRRFERQADVYAARTMEAKRRETAALLLQNAGIVAGAAAARPVVALPAGAPFGLAVAEAGATPVGPYGAALFASALQRVAVMNNIPLLPRTPARGGALRRASHSVDQLIDTAHNWFHGSIPRRMEYLRHLSADPALTGRFDRFMLRLYCTLLFALFASAAFFVASGGLPLR